MLFLEDGLRFVACPHLVLFQVGDKVKLVVLGFYERKFVQPFPDVVPCSFLYNGLIVF